MGLERELLDQVLTFLPPKDQEGDEEEPIQMAIIGRPNVGKSSLLNAICGEQRAIVSPIRGTTRDTIDKPHHDGHGEGFEAPSSTSSTGLRCCSHQL